MTMTNLIYKKGSLILLSGIPGSGKSTFTKMYFQGKENYIISSDEIRKSFFGTINSIGDNGELIEITNNVGKTIFEIMKTISEEKLKLGQTCVIDAMNLTDSDRNFFINIGDWAEVHTILFDIPLENALQNNFNRYKNGGNFVKEDIIKDKYQKLHRTTSIKGNIMHNAYEIDNVKEDINEITLIDDTKYYFLGDSHGIDCFIPQLNNILSNNNLSKLKIFILGDIVDRGEKSAENLLYVYELYKRFPDIFYFIKGNHELKVEHILKDYLETKILGDIYISTYKTIYQLFNIIEYGYNGNQQCISGKKYTIQEIYNFIKSFKSYITLINPHNNTKILLTHAPFVPPNNLGNINDEDCLFGMEEYRRRTNPIDMKFVKSLHSYGEKNNVIFIHGHVNYQSLLNEFYKNNDKYKYIHSIEGGVDAGGDFVYLEYHLLYNSKDNNQNENITFKRYETPSNFNFISKESMKNNMDLFENLLNKKIVTKNQGNTKYKSLSLYKYSRKVFYDHLWGTLSEDENNALLLARGIVFDNEGNIISFPFDKIFNYGEKVGSNENKPVDGEYQFIEKLNGFLGVISPDPYNSNDILLHTQGSLNDESEFSNYIKDLLSNQQKNNIINFYKEYGKYTLMFEVIHEKDPHIVSYSPDEYGLYLIGAREINSNDINNCPLLTEDKLDELGKLLGFKRPGHFISNLSRVLNDMETVKNLEGFMLRDIKTNEFVLKLKTPFYLISKFLGRMNEGNYNYLFSNKEKFIIEKSIDEEFFPLVDFIYDNKEKFKTYTKEEKVFHITNFILNKKN